MESRLQSQTTGGSAAVLEHPKGEGIGVRQDVPASKTSESAVQNEGLESEQLRLTGSSNTAPHDLGEKLHALSKEALATSEHSTQDMLHAQMQEVISYVEDFRLQISDHLRSTASCSRTAFDSLYEEMQGYKKNFLREAQRPLLLDLMMLYDSIDRLYRHYQKTPSVDREALFQNLDGLRSETEEILARVGIERMIVTSERLDVNCQRAVKTVPTDVPDENLAVVERISSGFYAGEHPLRKEQVVIKKYTPHL